MKINGVQHDLLVTLVFGNDTDCGDVREWLRIGGYQSIRDGLKLTWVVAPKTWELASFLGMLDDVTERCSSAVLAEPLRLLPVV